VAGAGGDRVSSVMLITFEIGPRLSGALDIPLLRFTGIQHDGRIARRAQIRELRKRVPRAPCATKLIPIGLLPWWLRLAFGEARAHLDLMPVVPMIETGLTPRVQCVVAPTLAFWVVMRRAPRAERN
jgi:hypothetical protein